MGCREEHQRKKSDLAAQDNPFINLVILTRPGPSKLACKSVGTQTDFKDLLSSPG